MSVDPAGPPVTRDAPRPLGSSRRMVGKKPRLTKKCPHTGPNKNTFSSHEIARFFEQKAAQKKSPKMFLIEHNLTRNARETRAHAQYTRRNKK